MARRKRQNLDHSRRQRLLFITTRNTSARPHRPRPGTITLFTRMFVRASDPIWPRMRLQEELCKNAARSQHCHAGAHPIDYDRKHRRLDLWRVASLILRTSPEPREYPVLARKMFIRFRHHIVGHMSFSFSRCVDLQYMLEEFANPICRYQGRSPQLHLLISAGPATQPCHPDGPARHPER
jgi:hypothetical protein